MSQMYGYTTTMQKDLFDGDTYDPAKDKARLGKQLEAVRDLMLDEEWRTLREIGYTLEVPEASVSARLRDLRKDKFGGYTVERRRVNDGGTWEYRIKLDDLPF